MSLASGKMRRSPRREFGVVAKAGSKAATAFILPLMVRQQMPGRAIDGAPFRRFLSYERAGSDNAG